MQSGYTFYIDHMIKKNIGKLYWGEFYLDERLRQKLGVPAGKEGAEELGIDFLSYPLCSRDGKDLFRTGSGMESGAATLKTTGELYRYDFPDVTSACLKGYNDKNSYNASSLILLDGPVQLFSSLVPFELFITALIREKEEMITLFTSYFSWLVKAVEHFADIPIAGVVLGDDVAGTDGPFYGPGLLDSLYFPLLESFVESIKPLPVIVHSDGDLRLLLSSYRDCGVAGIQSLEREAGMKMEELVEDHPDLVFWGGISRESLIANKKHLERELDIIMSLRRDGAFVAAGSTTGILDGDMNPGQLQIVRQCLDSFMI